MFLEVMNGTGDTEEHRNKIGECLQAAWSVLPQTLFDSLIKSIPAHVTACITAKGWHTKY
jgi:hypothetical protein